MHNLTTDASPWNAQRRKGELRTMMDHSSALHAKERFFKKVSETLWKTGYCMPASGSAHFQKTRKNESVSSNMQKSIKPIIMTCEHFSSGRKNLFILAGKPKPNQIDGSM